MATKEVLGPDCLSALSLIWQAVVGACGGQKENGVQDSPA